MALRPLYFFSFFLGGAVCYIIFILSFGSRILHGMGLAFWGMGTALGLGWLVGPVFWGLWAEKFDTTGMARVWFLS